MIRFGKLLLSQANEKKIEIEEIKPIPFFGRFNVFQKTSKWAAYIDKYLLFHKTLKRRLEDMNKIIDLVHIVDHSNSLYLPGIKKHSSAKCLVTCHDLIAVRTSLREFKEAPLTSKTGKKLQAWIYNSLNYADYYACDSVQTKRDLNRLIPNSLNLSDVIHLGTTGRQENHLTKKIKKDSILFDPEQCDYILHVGSDSWYKNRISVVKSFIKACKIHPERKLKLIFIGPELRGHESSVEIEGWIKANKDKVLFLNNVKENTLNYLYLNANLLLFPSFIEGFGWPPLEANIRGCQVICSRVGALGEILDKTATFIDPRNQQQINHAVCNLLNNPIQKRDSQKIMIPSVESCLGQYQELYLKVINNGSSV